MKASGISSGPWNRIGGVSNISRFGASHGCVFRSVIRHHPAEAAFARPKKPGLAPKRLIRSWTVDISRLGASPGSTFDLSAKNPNGGEIVVHRSPQDIVDEIAALDGESAEVLATIRELL